MGTGIFRYQLAVHYRIYLVRKDNLSNGLGRIIHVLADPPETVA